jgi:hypothetical protein
VRGAGDGGIPAEALRAALGFTRPVFVYASRQAVAAGVVRREGVKRGRYVASWAGPRAGKRLRRFRIERAHHPNIQVGLEALHADDASNGNDFGEIRILLGRAIGDDDVVSESARSTFRLTRLWPPASANAKSVRCMASKSFLLIR